VTDVFEEKSLETRGLVELCDHDQTFRSSP
jgi:hypothetical protein